MNEIERKKKAFEYLLILLLKWYEERKSKQYPNNLSKLKALKLLFFASAVNANENEGEDGLLDLFNKFYALPYGPVESDVYNEIEKLTLFTITRNELKLRDEIGDLTAYVKKHSYFDDINSWTEDIDSAVERLKEKSERLIEYSANDLVELSHLWNSWKLSYNYAERMGYRAYLIPKQIIKSDRKIFYLDVLS